MSSQLVVLLSNRVVGRVVQDDRGKRSFSYDEAWRDVRGSYPLSLSMPLAALEHRHDAISAYIWGLLQSYAKGVSPQAICHGLNERHIKPPRGGGHWHPSALLGMEARGSVILRNPIYVGRPVWNKNKMMKDPDTGKRIIRPNLPEKRIHQDAPRLRIIPVELFDSVQVQLAARSHRQQGENIVAHKRPQYLLSGLLKCDACGSGMVRCGRDKPGKTRLQCSLHRGSRSCPNPKSFYAEDVEALVMDSLTKELASPSQITNTPNPTLRNATPRRPMKASGAK